MYNDINLLTFTASTKEKYTNCLMEILFNREERLEGYIIEGPSSSKRKPLDIERVKLLKGISFCFIYSIYLISIIEFFI
jgi:hypothetical protein